MPEEPLHLVAGATSGVLTGTEHVDGQVLVCDRRQLSVPTRRAAERSFPHEFSGSRIQTAKVTFAKASLRDQEALVVIERRGIGDMNAREIPFPQQPSRVLLDGEDLAFGGMRVHATASARRKVLDRAFVPANPFDVERRR